MKILVLGKSPPLQGGVSTRTFNFVRQLRDLGHSIVFCSHSECSPATYRQDFTTHDDLIFRKSMADVELISVQRKERIDHIPFSQSFESRLIGACIDSASSADLIIGWYYQPFGVVAAILSRLTGTPFAVVHAGSDLGRLSAQADLRSAYSCLFSTGTIIASKQKTREIIQEIFVQNSEESIVQLQGGVALPWYYQRPPKKCSLENLIADRANHLKSWGICPSAKEFLISICDGSVSQGSVVVGIYGKIGEQKGHYELIQSLNKLIAEGCSCTLIVVGGGHAKNINKFSDELQALPLLKKHTVFLPFLPPWIIPEFIKLCDVVAFLERGFEISFHAPQVPREVLLVGTALLCSDEIVQKQRFRSELIDHVNYVNAGDPRDADKFESKLRMILNREIDLESVGISGRSMIIGHERRASTFDPVIRALKLDQIVGAEQAGGVNALPRATHL